VSRRFHHHVQAVGGDERHGVVGDEALPCLQCLAERPGAVLLLPPARSLAGGLGPIRVEVGDPEHLQTRGHPGLREKHGAELPGPDEADADGLLVYGAFQQHAVEVHGDFSCDVLRVEGVAPG